MDAWGVVQGELIHEINPIVWTLLRISKGRVVLMVHHPRSIHADFILKT
jgi:hypothetical protein